MLNPGVRLGPYEIQAALGAGGMGEVYKARDTRLGRDVAIKVLPPEVAADPDRKRRFEQEARAAAALNHSNILALYDIGTETPAGAPDISYIVTELLDGRTLRQTLEDERLTISRAIDVAAQIADGLAAAHTRAIVHRDIKPENIFLTTDGRAKILDFGLAKTVEVDARSTSDASTATGTGPHTVLGTAGYMAPEQVRAQPVDYRADIFAFGAVLYEMLGGRRAFSGDTALDTMSAILREAPASIVSSADRPLPPSLLRILERCLEKSPAARFQSTTDLAFALRSLSTTDSSAIGIAPAASSGRWWVLGAVAVLSLVTVAAATWWRGRSEPATLPVMQFAITAPPGTEFGPAVAGVAPFPAISPDGQLLVFTAGPSGDNPGLWLRTLGNITAKSIPNTAGLNTVLPFWSPNGRSIGFFSETKLKRVDLDTGVVRVLCDAAQPAGGSWAPDGTIIFASGGGPTRMSGALKRVSANGGTPTTLMPLNASRHEEAQRHPSFLPDGVHFLYQSAPDHMIWVGSLRGDAPKLLMPSDSRAIYVAPGYILCVREATLYTHKFDAGRLTIEGDPTPVVEDVRANGNNARSAFTVAENGTLVYRSGDLNVGRILNWMDRNGRVLQTIPGARANFDTFWLLPGDRAIIVHIHDVTQNGGDVWKVDLESGARTRLTTDPHHDQTPVISPDGLSFAWASDRVDPQQIFRKSTSGAGTDELWIRSALRGYPFSWSKHWLLFGSRPDGTREHIFAAPIDDVTKARQWLQSDFDESQARLSPNERWMAYESNETGRSDIYLRPFPDVNAQKWLLSADLGGSDPRWSVDGRQLYFVTQNRLVSVAVTDSGSAPEFGRPEVLFRQEGLTGGHYAVSSDGRRILVSTRPPDFESTSPLTVVLNWTGLLQGRKQ